ncbi:MAG: hypothetical protein V1797_16950 [Pseudomonadota bacterium]
MFGFGKKGAAADGAAVVDLPKPKDILQPLGQHLVVQENQDPDWVWRLKSVTRGNKSENMQEFRVFDPDAVYGRKLKVENFQSLDDHLDLVLFQGWYDKRTHQVQVKAA